jgi:hypothetical protein
MTRLVPFVLAGASTIAAAAAPVPPARSVLPWIEDDYSRALAEARAKKLPIFAEAWAPW